jgi:hypothetical protein
VADVIYHFPANPAYNGTRAPPYENEKCIKTKGTNISICCSGPDFFVRLNVFQQTVYTVACVQGTALITLSVSFNNRCHISPNCKLCMEYEKTGVLFRLILQEK